ncbi:uncharacterized protein B0P05DRAFT_577541 [Gilbertella persicaria]|uniref:uncharacterized protein n=1 Tax=Gilbertella persicaria TaxID=101096 RepID=UPI00221E68B2|nr:uncharacterized protein B0P05DRAFT_577541 [Gilbertella persicaria]KAI8091015.1 hypothetical protein B0P05DRAFT_577541 [Gilbertella persicaria]
MPASAKRKRGANSSSESFKEVRQKIRALEASLSDKSKLNNIVEIFQYAKSDNPQIVHAAVHSLGRVYTTLLSSGDLRKPKHTDENSAKFKVYTWLRENYLDYLTYVRSLLSSDEPGLQLPALNILLANMKAESESFMEHHGSYHFANAVYGPIVKEIITSTNFNEHMRKELVEKYLNVYDDLRHYFLKDAAEVMEQAYQKKETQKKSSSYKKVKLSNEADSEDNLRLMATNVLLILEGIRTMPTEANEIDEFWTVNPIQYEPKSKQDNKTDDLLGDEGLLSDSEPENEETAAKKEGKKRKHPLLQLRVHKRGFSDCWLSLMKLPLTEEMYKRILLILHKRILPHMHEPKLLMDFLTDSYNVGGAVSLLALNGLFTLIVDHNL